MSKEGYRYATDLHTWVTVNGDEVTVGFSEYSCDRMEEMVALDMKQPGDEVKQEEPCGVVDVMKALVDIPAPVSGVILEVNPKVMENVDLSREDSYGEGWLLKMRMSNPAELESLLSRKEYEAQA